MVGCDRGGQHFRCAGSRRVHQYGDGIPPHDLLGIGGEHLRRDGLAAQSGQRSAWNEKTRDGYRFRYRPAPAFAQVQNHFVNPLLFGVQQAVAYFISAARVERGETQRENVRVGLLDDQFRGRQLLADDVDLVRCGLAAANHGNLDRGAWLAVQKIHCLANGHVAARKSADRF